MKLVVALIAGIMAGIIIGNRFDIAPVWAQSNYDRGFADGACGLADRLDKAGTVKLDRQKWNTFCAALSETKGGK